MDIYSIKNTQNGKKYIGSSKEPKVRIRKHKRLLSNDEHFNPHLQNSYNKYGEESFDFKIVEETNAETEEELYDIEQKYIDKEDPGYNFREATGPGWGAVHNHRNSEQIYEKIGKVNQGNESYLKGKTYEEYFGKKKAQKIKSKISGNREYRKGKKHPRWNSSNYDVWLKKYGKEKADEKLEQFKQKCSKTSSGMKNPRWNSKINRKTLLKQLNEKRSATQVAEKFDASLPTVCRRCKIYWNKSSNEMIELFQAIDIRKVMKENEELSVKQIVSDMDIARITLDRRCRKFFGKTACQFKETI